VTLAECLADQAFEDLPKEFGQTDPTNNPNPHYITLSFGDIRGELLLPPKTEVSVVRPENWTGA
jgi:hypothetical protein